MLSRLVTAPIRFYQRFLSPLKPYPTCRYLPTCSSYAIEAVQQRGVIVGSLMALWRLLRCNPLFPGGYDPVVPVERRIECHGEHHSEHQTEPVDAKVERGSSESASSAASGDSPSHRANRDHCASHAREPLDIESVRI